MRAIGSVAMRGVTASPHNEPVELPENAEDLGQSMELQLQLNGSGAAAWLIWTHRKRLRRNKMVDFRMPKNKETPPWFRIAFEFLRRRAGWEGVVLFKLDERIYRVIRLSRAMTV